MGAEYVNYLIVGVGTVVWYLLRQKDEKQAQELADLKASTHKSVELLFAKHDEDAKALADLKLQIADGHYKKTELDNRFDKLEGTFKSGFAALGKQMEELSKALIAHMQKEDSR